MAFINNDFKIGRQYLWNLFRHLLSIKNLLHIDSCGGFSGQGNAIDWFSPLSAYFDTKGENQSRQDKYELSILIIISERDNRDSNSCPCGWTY